MKTEFKCTEKVQDRDDVILSESLGAARICEAIIVKEKFPESYLLEVIKG